MIFAFVLLIFSHETSGDSFVFGTYHKKGVVVTKQKKNSYFTNFFQKSNRYLTERNWYYVHVESDHLPDLLNAVTIETTNIILKNTFLLFLSNDQLDLISDFALTKKLEPNEKIYFDIDSIENVKYILITGYSDFQIELLNPYYSIEFRLNSENIIVRFDQNDLTERQFLEKKISIVNQLSQIPEVQYISIYTNPVLNNLFSVGFTQKPEGKTNSQYFDVSFNPTEDEYFTLAFYEKFINNNKINGENEIITIIDTAIDPYHAQFHDADHNFDVNKDLGDHRKFVYYKYNGTLSDLQANIGLNEHGTHVAGIAAGNSMCNSDLDSYFDGMAPAAKILYAGHFNDFTSNEFQNLLRNYKSRISTNSWNYPDGFNDASNNEWGKIAYENPQTTFIFSAGNAGLYSAIGDPAGSKNILSVGALASLLTENDNSDRYIAQCSDKDDAYFEIRDIRSNAPFQGNFSFEKGKGDILIINSSSISSSDDLVGDQIVIIINDSYIDSQWFSANTPGLYLAVLDALQSISACPPTSKLIIWDYRNPANKIRLFDFSSRGPGNRGIRKPELVVPGADIGSAQSSKYRNDKNFHGCASNGESAYTYLNGTSQAAPNVAGAAALIRDYFSRKWSVGSVNLDSNTVRALLINSCKYIADVGTITDEFGHGYADLSSILPFDESFGVAITPQDQFSITKESVTGQGAPQIVNNSQMVASLTVKESGKLQISLVYLDPVLNYDSPLILANDLDLFVIGPNGEIFTGDHLPLSENQHLSTIEKIIIQDAKPGTYTIHVFSSNFLGMGTKQIFSVVASGPIDNQYLHFETPETCGAISCNLDKPLHYDCNSTACGPLCLNQVANLNSEIYIILQPHSIYRAKFISSTSITHIISIANDTVLNPSIFIDKECHSSLSEYSDTGTSGENETDPARLTNIGSGLDKEICVAILNNNVDDTAFMIKIISKEEDDDESYIPIIIGCAVAAVVIIVVIVIIIYWVRKNKKDRSARQSSQQASQSGKLNEKVQDI